MITACKDRLVMCVVDLEKVFNIVSWKVLEWVMRKKGIAKVLDRSVMRV